MSEFLFNHDVVFEIIRFLPLYDTLSLSKVCKSVHEKILSYFSKKGFFFEVRSFLNCLRAIKNAVKEFKQRNRNVNTSIGEKELRLVLENLQKYYQPNKQIRNFLINSSSFVAGSINEIIFFKDRKFIWEKVKVYDKSELREEDFFCNLLFGSWESKMNFVIDSVNTCIKPAIVFTTKIGFFEWWKGYLEEKQISYEVVTEDEFSKSSEMVSKCILFSQLCDFSNVKKPDIFFSKGGVYIYFVFFEYPFDLFRKRNTCGRFISEIRSFFSGIFFDEGGNPLLRENLFLSHLRDVKVDKFLIFTGYFNISRSFIQTSVNIYFREKHNREVKIRFYSDSDGIIKKLQSNVLFIVNEKIDYIIFHAECDKDEVKLKKIIDISYYNDFAFRKFRGYKYLIIKMVDQPISKICEKKKIENLLRRMPNIEVVFLPEEVKESFENVECFLI